MQVTIDISYVDLIAKNLDWKKFITDNPDVPIEFLEKYKDYIDFNILVKGSKPTLDFIKRFKERLDINKLTSSKNITFDIICEVSDHYDVNWKALTKNFMTQKFINKFKGKPLDWNYISRNYKCLSEKFVHQYRNYLNWSLISYSGFSVDFLQKHSTYVDWDNYLVNYELDELEILANIQYLKWNFVALFQPLSIEFIKRFHENMKSEDLLKNLYFTEDQKTEIIRIYNANSKFVYPISIDSHETCSVCLEEGGTLHVLPCKHEFHQMCIVTWLCGSEKKTCPMCRYQLD